MKQVLHTQKSTQSRSWCSWRLETKKSSLWHPEWHVDASSVIGRLKTSSAPPPLAIHQCVPLHPLHLLCNSYYQPSYPPPLFYPTIVQLILSPQKPSYPPPTYPFSYTSLSVSFVAYILFLILLLYPSLSLSCCILIINLPSWSYLILS